MDFIHTAAQALPDNLCDELIARFKSHPGRHAGITTSSVTLAKKSSLDLTIDNFDDLRDIRQRVLNIALEDLTDYFIQYPFFGSINPSVRDPVTGGTINIQKYAANSGGYIPTGTARSRPRSPLRGCTAWYSGCTT